MLLLLVRWVLCVHGRCALACLEVFGREAHCCAICDSQAAAGSSLFVSSCACVWCGVRGEWRGNVSCARRRGWRDRKDDAFFFEWGGWIDRFFWFPVRDRPQCLQPCTALALEPQRSVSGGRRTDIRVRVSMLLVVNLQIESTLSVREKGWERLFCRQRRSSIEMKRNAIVW